MPLGIPHSVFLGWDPDDRDKAIWWTIHQRQRCLNCGTRPDEWNEKRGGNLDAYIPEPYSCRGCQVLAQGQDWLEHHRKEVARGTSIRLVARED